MKLATLVVALSVVPASVKEDQPLAFLIGAGGLIFLLGLLFVAFGRGARHEHENEQRRRNQR